MDLLIFFDKKKKKVQTKLFNLKTKLESAWSLNYSSCQLDVNNAKFVSTLICAINEFKTSSNFVSRFNFVSIFGHFVNINKKK